jgi:drug/metabolite transporter (DMT)-like permease
MYNAFLYLVTVLIWGSTWLAIKFQLGIVAPELSIAYRFALAGILLLIFSSIRRLPLRFNWRAHSFIALQGLLLFSLNYFLVYVAEGYLTSGLVAIIFSLIIIMNIILGAIFLRNPIRARVVLGAIVGLIGLSLVFWPELISFDLSSGRALGIGLAIIATVSASLGNVVSARNQRQELPVVQTNAFGMLYGSFFMLLLALFRGAQLQVEPTLGYLASLLYLAVFGSVIAFGSYLTLLGRIGLDRAAYVTVLFPIIALLLSTFFEDLQWGLLQLVGIALVLLGNLIVITKFQITRVSKVAEKQSTSG